MAVRSLKNRRKLLARLVGQQQAALTSSQAEQEGGREDKKEQKGGRSHYGWPVAGLLGAGLAFTAPLLADEGKKKVFGKTQADRVRQYATTDNVFDHFATYQLVNDLGEPQK